MPIHANKVRQMLASPSSGYIYISGAGTADGDRISLNGRIYEFDTNAALNPGANVQIDVSLGAGAAASITALVAAINGDTSRVVDAVDLGGNVCGLVARTAGASIYALLYQGATITGSASVTGGAVESRLSLQLLDYTFLAVDVATLAGALGTNEIVIAAFPSTLQPVLLSIVGRTAAGVVLDMTDGILVFRQAGTGFWALCYAEPAGGALFAAGGKLSLLLGRVGV